MDWMVPLAVVGTLLVLFAFHTLWGQYILNPSRRTRDHVRRCIDCRTRLLALPSLLDGEQLCPIGRELLERYGAWGDE